MPRHKPTVKVKRHCWGDTEKRRMLWPFWSLHILLTRSNLICLTLWNCYLSEGEILLLPSSLFARCFSHFSLEHCILWSLSIWNCYSPIISVHFSLFSSLWFPWRMACSTMPTSCSRPSLWMGCPPWPVTPRRSLTLHSHLSGARAAAKEPARRITRANVSELIKLSQRSTELLQKGLSAPR